MQARILVAAPHAKIDRLLLQKRIYEWSKELPPWQRDLLRRVASGSFDDAGRREVMQILAGTPDASEPIPLELKDLPADEGEHGQVELRAIRDLANINRLAPGQELKLECGLNGVFGDNGSGKSGYGRLIRRVTRSGEPEEILRDVFDPGAADGAQTAQFDIAVDGVERSVAVDLATDPDRTLSAMAAFDVSRARLFLTKPNVIEHVPRSLRVLRALSRAQDDIAATLRERAQQRREAIPALPEIDPNTPAGKELEQIDADSDLAALITLIDLTDTERTRLEELELAAAAIRTDQSRQLESAAKRSRPTRAPPRSGSPTPMHSSPPRRSPNSPSGANASTTSTPESASSQTAHSQINALRAQAKGPGASCGMPPSASPRQPTRPSRTQARTLPARCANRTSIPKRGSAWVALRSSSAPPCASRRST